jgi:hypothetical protein
MATSRRSSQNSGSSGLLLLSRKALSSSAPYRFIPAHRQLDLPAVWDAVQRQIQESPGLEAKTLFEWLQREYPGRFSDGQIRTLQRRIKLWRVTEGPAQEVYFGQKHVPGRLCASDFTHMTEVGDHARGADV